jgi:lipid-binding SYLF domain-containing protein
MTDPKAPLASRRRILAGAGLALLPTLLPSKAFADDRQALIDRAKLTVDSLRDHPNFKKDINELLDRATGAFIMPNRLRAGFVLGAEGGAGVLLGRESDGSWSAPAFYTYGSGSVGLQIGISWSEVLIIILTKGGLERFVQDQFKLGVDGSIAFGPEGAGLSGGMTRNLRVDMVAYARTEGAFMGGALEGTVLRPRREDNEAYYGPGATPRAIVLDRTFDAGATTALRQALGGIR